MNGQIVECFFESRIGKIHGERIFAARGRLYLGIEHHVDAGQLAHGLIKNLDRLIVHLQSADLAGDGLQFRDREDTGRLCLHFLRRLLAGRQAPIFRRCCRCGSSRFLLLPFHHFFGAADLLFCNRQRWIGRVRLLEFVQAFFQISGSPNFLPKRDVANGGLKAHSPYRHLISGIFRICGISFFIRLQRLVVVLAGLGLPARLHQLFAGLVLGTEHCRNQHRQ